MKCLHLAILVDRSTSAADYINEVNQVLLELAPRFKNDPHIQDVTIMLSIAQFPVFPGENTYLIKDHNILSEEDPVFTIKIRGNTNPIKSLKTVAADLVRSTENFRRDNGISCVKPCLIYISDHKINAGTDRPDGTVDPVKQAKLLQKYDEICQKLQEYQENDLLELHAFAIGDSDTSNVDKLKLGKNNVHRFDKKNVDDTVLELFGKIYDVTAKTLPQADVVEEMFGDG
ncbi:MAG: hypothetical protein IKJ69_04150 [Clostridia bacterium]|nr:hypothetical protein [Clostridia bacterium]